MSIKLNSVGGGSVTIQEPNTASDFTLSVPAITANILTNKTAGTVLQVVQGITSTQVESSYSSATNLGLSLSITPTSATSKILVIVTPAGCGSRDTSSHWVITLRRNTTNLLNFATYIGSNSINGVETYPSCSFIDSPNTTSSVSYNLIGTRSSGSADCYFNHSDGTAVSTMVAMEIAA
jgi:hypothetical protein